MNLAKIAKGTKGVKAAKAVKRTAKLGKAIKSARKAGKVVVGTRILKKSAETESILAKARPFLKPKKVPRKSHFNGTYKLKPNATYKVKGYTYKTDHLGRIKGAEGNLKLKNGTRNATHQRKVGGADRLKTDDGGHLIGTRFDGSGKVDNIVPMNSNLNRGEFKKLENSWAKALKNGQKVDVKITPVYKGDALRPNSFKVTQTIDGIKSSKILKNKPGG
jgi:predicted ribonuclease toxin of YeeF-YezG toxin-antitoxin module